MTGLILSVLCMLLIGCKTQSNNIQDNEASTIIQDRHSTTVTEVQFTDEENTILDAVASDQLLEVIGKTFDQNIADAKYENEKNNPGINDNPNCDENIEDKLCITHLLLDENLYNRLIYADSFEFNLDSLINNGLMAIVPQNPYTGNDITTSLDYSPGNCFLAADERGVIFIYHSGEKEMAFEPNRESHAILTYQKNDKQPELYSDGRSQIHYHKFSPSEYSELVSGGEGMKSGQFRENNNPEFRKIYWLQRQVFEMMTRYSQMNENVLQSLEDYINYVGRVNSPAWINPYTDQPMQQVGFALECEYRVNQDMSHPGAPVSPDMLDEQMDKSHYAGNYSFATYTDEEGPISVFAIYYLKPDGNLAALSCRAVPKTRFLEELGVN